MMKGEKQNGLTHKTYITSCQFGNTLIKCFRTRYLLIDRTKWCVLNTLLKYPQIGMTFYGLDHFASQPSVISTTPVVYSYTAMVTCMPDDCMSNSSFFLCQEAPQTAGTSGTGALWPFLFWHSSEGLYPNPANLACECTMCHTYIARNVHGRKYLRSIQQKCPAAKCSPTYTWCMTSNL